MPSTADRRFTVPEDVLLADCVSKHRCLYDKDHMYHGNGKIKERLWAEIAKTLDRSVFNMRGPHTPPGSPPPSPIPVEEEREQVYYDGSHYAMRVVGMRGPHTPPGSPPPSPIPDQGEDYSDRQVMAQPASNIVAVALQNPSPGTEGSKEGQIATQMTSRTNQKILPVYQPLLLAASGSSIFHGRSESSRSQNRDKPNNSPPMRPQQDRGTKHEYRSPSNLRKRKEKQLESNIKKKMLKHQVMQAPRLKHDYVHVATNHPSVPTTSSTAAAAAGAAPQTPEQRIDDTGSVQVRETVVDLTNE